MLFSLVIALLQTSGKLAGLKGKVTFAAACRQTQSQIQIKMTVQFDKMPWCAVGAYARQMQIGIAANP
ncbi:hypothetical protein NEISICOT_00850 [Neisseria sicca ATCC 29256]|uniref:Uncharacterized protein n=1 Tax=Neisseria sicca ATCC 29256 TaxID=547045 RepID=C6M2V9_NEISI|nr:hypothetical protein NEISICOT_00850 [Neisseria sicca ATCC 29256]